MRTGDTIAAVPWVKGESPVLSGFAEARMSRETFSYCVFLLLVTLMFSASLQAQTVCDEGNGPLDSAQPSGITTAEIIQKFAAKEAIFKAARERYGYTLDVSVQSVDIYGKVDGEYRQVSEVLLNSDGKRAEKTTYAPQNTLRRLSLTQDDLDDIRERLPFALTPEALPQFLVSYAGRQHVDQLNTYVFNVSPKNAKKEKKLFEGRIWVDDQDLMIVKTCGKPREDENANSKKKNVQTNLTPLFVTYREQIDGQYWFPTYSRANEFLSFPKSLIHVREVVKYSDYKPLVPK
jgi:hypothetical protein